MRHRFLLDAKYKAKPILFHPMEKNSNQSQMLHFSTLFDTNGTPVKQTALFPLDPKYKPKPKSTLLPTHSREVPLRMDLLHLHFGTPVARALPVCVQFLDWIWRELAKPQRLN